MFVLGSNDLFAPEPFNPALYLLGPSSARRKKKAPDLPWEKLRDGMTTAGWLDLDNRRGRLTAGGLDIAVAGVDDAHINRDRYAQVAGRADAGADLRLAVMHSPEPRLLDEFVADGYDLLLAGHTHGGQLCLPWYGPLVTNCGIDRKRARGLHRYPEGGQAWLHVSAGLGTSPWAPARFACRPEASLLTLTSRGLPADPAPVARTRLAADASPTRAVRVSAKLAEVRLAPRSRSGRRGVAQLGSALRSGRRGRGFKSGHPDQLRRHVARAGLARCRC